MATDGEGIRTLILTEGCPLRCKYCVNPFTWDGSHKSRQMTAKEIQDELQIDRLYMLASCGGITFGGGEPLLHPQLISELRQIIEPDLTIYAETSLNVATENVKVAAKCVDQFIIDIKTVDPQIYKRYTGEDNKQVLENLETLLSLKGNAAVVVRIPIIPGFTDKENQARDRDFLSKKGVCRFDLFSYIIPKDSK